LANPHEIEQWLQEGIAAAKAGDVQIARFRLLDVVEQDQANETAWYWLYQVFDRVDDQRTCLQNLILLNPNNHWAKEELLKHLESSRPSPAAKRSKKPTSAKKSKRAATRKAPRPVTLKLVTAFWIGISTIFLSSGIISAAVWFTARLNGQLQHSNNQLFEGAELLIGIVFFIVGVVGFYVAVMLLFQSMIGFYGSLLLALGLLLVGPVVSLIATPPNYVTMLCTGGISGMIVLLTLASQPGFEKISQDDNSSPAQS